MKEQKTLLRSVMRLLHPDLFTAYPMEQEVNADALKRLNHYLDEVAQSLKPEPVSLQFWIRRDDCLKEVRTRLENDGSLAPLYYALDLITHEEYLQWTSEISKAVVDEDLVDWLKTFVGKVVEDGERHATLRKEIANIKASLETKHKLKNIHMGSEFSMRVAELKVQVDLLKILEDALERTCSSDAICFAGLSLCVHQSDGRPLNPYASSEHHRSWISDDGCLHVVVLRETIISELKRLDLDRAGLLTNLHSFWERRATDLRQSLRELFQVEDVLCDVTTASSAQRFVLWAGCILTNREEIEKRLAAKTLPLTLLVHSDNSAPMVDYSTASSTLHVSTDCTPMFLLNFVQSDRCLNASDEAQEMLTDDIEEKQILEKARKALGAKQVIRVCSIYERQQAIKAAERLIQNAESIRQSVDLSDAGIAIDSNYHAWDSGFISIPHDYHMTELRPNLKRLIADGKGRPRASSANQTKRPMAYVRAMQSKILRKTVKRRMPLSQSLVRHQTLRYL